MIPDFSPSVGWRTVSPMKRAKRKYRRTFFKEWRDYRELTLGQVASRIDMTASNLSKIERGVQPYTQPILEALAVALSTSKTNLLDRKPGSSEDDLGAALDELDSDARSQALAVIHALKNTRAA